MQWMIPRMMVTYPPFSLLMINYFDRINNLVKISKSLSAKFWGATNILKKLTKSKTEIKWFVTAPHRISCQLLRQGNGPPSIGFQGRPYALHRTRNDFPILCVHCVRNVGGRNRKWHIRPCFRNDDADRMLLVFAGWSMIQWVAVKKCLYIS